MAAIVQGKTEQHPIRITCMVSLCRFCLQQTSKVLIQKTLRKTVFRILTYFLTDDYKNKATFKC